MSLTKITDSVVETFSRWFRVNSTTGAITSVIPDLSGSNTTLYPGYLCRAWVNFDGKKDTTGASSTSNTNRLIRGSGNVLSVLRNGTGDYTINFSIPMPDTNYACNVTTSNDSSAYPIKGIVTTYAVGSIGIIGERNTNGNMIDSEFLNVVVFR
jgi:hypothetical protein